MKTFEELMNDIKNYKTKNNFILLLELIFNFKQLKRNKNLWWSEVKWQFYFILRHVPPFSWLDKAKWWFLHRTFHRYHIVDSGLSPGWHDKDHLMLNVCFQLLVDFIERELAWFQFWQEEDKVPWYRTKSWYVKKHAERLGLSYLESEMKMTMEYNNQEIPEGEPQVNHEGTQGWHAKQQKELYLWWKYTRNKDYEDLDKLLWKDGPDWRKERELLEQLDDKQLERLIKVRKGLWI